MSVRMESQKRVIDLRREDATLATSLSEERHGEQVLSRLTFKTIKTEVATLAASLSEERHGEQVLSRLTFKTIKREVATLTASLSGPGTGGRFFRSPSRLCGKELSL